MDDGTKATFDLQDLKDPGYEIFILLVSVLSVANLIVMFVPGLIPIPSAWSRSSISF